MGFKNTVFGFQRYELALQTVDFLDVNPPDTFYTHMRSNSFRVRRHQMQPGEGDVSVTYNIVLRNKQEYCSQILDKNVSIRVINDAIVENDVPELIIESFLKIDPDIHDHATFLERTLEWH